MCAGTHTDTQKHTRVDTHGCVHAHTGTYTYTHKHMHTHINIHIIHAKHTTMHMYICVHT